MKHISLKNENIKDLKFVQLLKDELSYNLARLVVCGLIYGFFMQMAIISKLHIGVRSWITIGSLMTIYLFDRMISEKRLRTIKILALTSIQIAMARMLMRTLLPLAATFLWLV